MSKQRLTLYIKKTKKKNMFRACKRTEDKEYKNGTECDLHGISIGALLLSKIISLK